MRLCESLITHHSHFHILIKPTYQPAARGNSANLPLVQQESTAVVVAVEEKCAGSLWRLGEKILIGTLTYINNNMQCLVLRAEPADAESSPSRFPVGGGRTLNTVAKLISQRVSA